jgi:hypothetical protein
MKTEEVISVGNFYFLIIHISIITLINRNSTVYYLAGLPPLRQQLSFSNERFLIC